MDESERGALMALENLLIADLLMNLSILLCVQTALGRPHFPTLGRALLLMSVNTALGRLIFPKFWGGPIPQTVVCLICGFLIARETRLRKILTASAAIFCATCAAAGFAGKFGLFPGAIASLAAFACLLRRQKHPAAVWLIEISIEKNGVRERVKALIDTGNRLTERKSALPVLIIEERAVPALSRVLAALEESEIRLFPFGVLGSGGEMKGFYPDRIWMHTDEGDIPGPDCWVGLFKDRIPGRTQALAPAEFSERIHNRRPVTPTDTNILRRVSYAILNRQTIDLRPRGADPARFSLLHRRQRPASASLDQGRGNHDDPQGAFGRYAGKIHND